jgi:hypothetical protein
MLKINKRELQLHPEYIKIGAALLKVRTEFKNWVTELDKDPLITVEDAMMLMKQYDISIPRLLNHNFEYPITLYRTRVIPEHLDCDLSEPSNFSYPPASACEHFQRANAPGYPVFYGAMDGQTAMEELRINGEPLCANDTIFLSKWRVREGVKANYANLTMRDITEAHQLSAEITKNTYREFERIFKDQEDFFKKTQSILFQESSAFFLKGSHIQSGTIAYEILYNTQEAEGIRINGIMYPSVCNEFRSINFALHPDFVDHSLELLSVKKFTFREFANKGSHGTVSYFGKPEGGKLVWTTLLSELKTQDFKIELALDLGWTAQQINQAKFIFKGAEINLRDYCAKRVDAIDLSKNTVKQDDMKLYEENTESVLILEQLLDDGVAFLQDGDRINGISTIRMLVPLFMRTKIVDPKEVLKSNR